MTTRNHSDGCRAAPAPTETAVVLLGRGGYEGEAGHALRRLAQTLNGIGPYGLVVPALLDQGEPSLPTALAACVAAGARRVLVVPLFLPADDGLLSWVAKRLRRWLRLQSGPDLSVALLDPLGAQPALAEAVARSIETGVWRDVREHAPVDRDDPSWSVIPRHARHVLVCHGPRCTERGAADTRRRLLDRLAEYRLDRGPGQALVVTTGCQYPCNLGPMMVVYPEGIWYGGLTPSLVDRIVERHLCRGEVVGEHAIPPGSRRRRSDAASGDAVSPRNPSAEATAMT